MLRRRRVDPPAPRDDNGPVRNDPERWPAFFLLAALGVFAVSLVAIPNGRGVTFSPFYFSAAFGLLMILRFLAARGFREAGRAWILYLVLTATSIGWAVPLSLAVESLARRESEGAGSVLGGALAHDGTLRFLSGHGPWITLLLCVAAFLALPGWLQRRRRTAA